MEGIKKLGDVVRNHYEKFILILALIILGGAIGKLYSASQQEQEKIRGLVVDVTKRKVKPVPEADMARAQALLKLAANPPGLVLAGEHNLLNPVKWQQKADNTLVKIQTGKEVGPAQMTVLETRPLKFIVSLDRIPSPGGYIIGVTDEANENPALRRKQQRFAALNTKNEFFTLKEIKGPPENPAGLVLELANSEEKVTIAKDKPFERIDGYEADLNYKVDGKEFKDRRVGDTIHFGGEDYNIVAINPNEVVLSARNDKKYTVR